MCSNKQNATGSSSEMKRNSKVSNSGSDNKSTEEMDEKPYIQIQNGTAGRATKKVGLGFKF